MSKINITYDDSGYGEWKSGAKGTWVTIRGHHLFLKKGESPAKKLKAIIKKVSKKNGKKESPKQKILRKKKESDEQKKKKKVVKPIERKEEKKVEKKRPKPEGESPKEKILRLKKESEEKKKQPKKPKKEEKKSERKLPITKGKSPKEGILKKARELAKQPKEEKKEEEKETKKKTRSKLTPEERKRKEIEAQAKRTKKTKDLPDREKKIQKLIEQTGYDRKRAESIIDKKSETPKEKVIKKVEKIKAKKGMTKKMLEKKSQIIKKTNKLKELNKEKKSGLLGELLKMITNYLATGNKNTSQFANAYIRLRKSKDIDEKRKIKLLNQISSIRNEVNEYHNKKDFTEDYPVEGYTKKDGTKVKYHTRGEVSKENFNLDHEQIEYYDNAIKEAHIKLKEAKKEFNKSEKRYEDKNKLEDAKKELTKHKNIKKFRIYEQRLFYDYPISYEEYKDMIKDLKKTVLWLRDKVGYFESKRRSVWDQHMDWDTQLSLTKSNMRELSGGVKKSWRRTRWRNLANETTEDISSAPYIYEIKGKRYLAHSTSSLKKFIRETKDFTEDYPVNEYTKKDGTKVKTHTRGEIGLERFEREQKEEKLKNKFIKHGIKSEKLQKNYDEYLESILDLIQHEGATPKEVSEVVDDLNIKEVHNILKVYYGMPYNEHKKRSRFGRKHGFTPSKKRWLEGHRTEDFTEDYPVEGYTTKSGKKVKSHTRGEGTEKENESRRLKMGIEGLINLLEFSKFHKDERIRGHIQNLEGIKNIRFIKSKNSQLEQEKESIIEYIGQEEWDKLHSFKEVEKEKEVTFTSLGLRRKTSKELGKDFTHDFISTDTLKDITLDFQEKGDFTIMHGPITRDGAFEYEKNGRKVIYYKDWANIKEVFDNLSYIPLKAQYDPNSHQAKILGYATNFKPNDKTRQMFSDVVLFNDIDKLTDLLDEGTQYQVSIGFKDRIENGIQWIEYIDHLAMSLSNADTGRCLTANGKSCYAEVLN